MLVLSIAVFAFSLGFQTTSRYTAEYTSALGATALVVGLFGTFGNAISAVYPTPAGRSPIEPARGTRGRSSDSSRRSASPSSYSLPLAWKSFGLGATVAIVERAVPPSRLAAGFASTETFRRTAFLVGPLLTVALFFPFGSTPLRDRVHEFVERTPIPSPAFGPRDSVRRSATIRGRRSTRRMRPCGAR